MSKSKLRQKDISNIVDIKEVAEQYRDSSHKILVERYERDNLILIEQLRDLKHALVDRDSRIFHLEELLKQNTPSYLPNLSSPVSDEEIIALKQLERLKEASQIRNLSLEEIKMYDLLVKNKRLAQGDSTGIIDTVKLPKEKTKLIEIASKKINEQIEE